MVWDAAVRDYDDSRGRMTSLQSLAPFNQEIVSFESLEGFLEERNKEFKSFRANKKRLFDALQSALQPVRAIGNITSGAVSVVNTLELSIRVRQLNKS